MREGVSQAPRAESGAALGGQAQLLLGWFPRRATPARAQGLGISVSISVKQENRGMASQHITFRCI